MVKICLPRAGEGREQELFVGLNGVGYRVARGVEVSVPEAVAEVLRHSEGARLENEAFLRASEGGI